MPVRIASACILGLEGIPVRVEVDELRGLPAFHLVGLGGKAVREARERILSAIANAGFLPPRQRVVVNLAPADIPKEGPGFDLPIALGILAATGQCIVPPNVLVLGELSLSSEVQPIPGVLPLVRAARREGIKKVYVPHANVREAMLVRGVEVFGVPNLSDLVAHWREDKPLPPPPPEKQALVSSPSPPFAAIRGQTTAKRALLVAAAGAHNMLMVGPPGAGKSLLAQELPKLLPPLTQEEAEEVTSIYSVRGLLPPGAGLLTQRPFRSPHHGASAVALIGGGSVPQAGEVTLAHRGVLFLDELPEFPRSVLDQLRQPLESGYVTVARAARTLRFPARFMLVAAMNPCPCGYADTEVKPCRCAPGEVVRYRRRVSGPFLDRLDLQIVVPPVQTREIFDAAPTPEAKWREQVQMARQRQSERLGMGRTNAEMSLEELKRYCLLTAKAEVLLRQAAEHYRLSVRGIHRTMKIARTLADLAGEEKILPHQIAEALQYRTAAEEVLAP
jgi:magnesium chelatase family protein